MTIIFILVQSMLSNYNDHNWESSNHVWIVLQWSELVSDITQMLRYSTSYIYEICTCMEKCLYIRVHGYPVLLKFNYDWSPQNKSVQINKKIRMSFFACRLLTIYTIACRWCILHSNMVSCEDAYATHAHTPGHLVLPTLCGYELHFECLMRETVLFQPLVCGLL